MTSDQAMRASDGDRERAAEVLRDAYAVGRLDLEEFHDRAGAAYSAKTWGDLRDLTADLPAGQVLSRVTSGADSHTGVARLGHAPWRPFAPIWVMAAVWLAIAAAAPTVAVIPLVLLSLFVLLRAARWAMRPEQPPQCRVHPSGEHAVQAQPLWATQALGCVPDDQVKRAEWEQRDEELAQPTVTLPS